MRRSAPFLACLLLLGVSVPLHAQVLGTGVTPTAEVPGPLLTASAATAISTATTAVNTELLVVDSATNLIPVEVVVVAGGVMEDLAAIADILHQVEGLSLDIHSLTAQLDALFNLDLAPDTSGGLRERLAEVRRVKAQAYVTALKLQTLMLTALRTVRDATELVNSIAVLLGQQQNLQVLNQHMSAVLKEMTTLQVVTSSFYRAQSVEAMEKLLIGESRTRITAKVYQVE